MGQLRSALSAASRVAEGPARALDVLGRYARSVDGAEKTTAVQTFIDWDTRTITYSSAGHPPPALLRADGPSSSSTRPPTRRSAPAPNQVPRPQATAAFTDGATLVLYTDGLIERRREDIDTGLRRLADALARHQGADPEATRRRRPAGAASARRRHGRHRVRRRTALTPDSRNGPRTWKTTGFSERVASYPAPISAGTGSPTPLS